MGQRYIIAMRALGSHRKVLTAKPARQWVVSSFKVIIYDRGGRETTFYGENFRGPLRARTKNFAAHSASRDYFSVPTPEEYHR